MSLDSLETGKKLRTLLDENPGFYMVELYPWDFFAVDITSHHYSTIVYDRTQDFRSDITPPSIFSQEPDNICKDHIRKLKRIARVI